MARILLIGGHGKIALLAEPLLVGAGHTVDAVIRSADQSADVAATGANPVVADVGSLDATAFAGLVRGHDVVVWSAGAGGGDAARTRGIDRDAAVASVRAAESAGADRYVMVSYFGAGADHGVDPEDGFYAYAEAKAAADAVLRESALEWTILAPSSLTLDPPTGRIDADAAQPTHVSRADVAAVIVAALGDDRTIGRTISFNAGDEPIPRALAGL